MPSPESALASDRSQTPRTAMAAFVGTALEWYDFLIYGTAAALVFNKVFFPALSPVAGTLAAFAAFGVGFVARPLGGLVLGNLGDRMGRRKNYDGSWTEWGSLVGVPIAQGDEPALLQE